MKIIDKDFLYGKLVRAYGKGTLKEYHDWREPYYNMPGMIHYFRVTDNPFEGFEDYDLVAIYINDPGNLFQPYLKTSEVEDIQYEDNLMKVTTLNSVYEFALGDFDLTEGDKEDLMSNRIFKTNEASVAIRDYNMKEMDD